MKLKLLPALLVALTVPAVAGGLPPLSAPPKEYPPGPLGETVKLGRELIMHTDTDPLTREFVGNKLTCASCHIDGGTTDTPGTFIGSATAFPAWSGREGSVQTLQDRIANCFMRSMNGKRPPIDSRPLIAMTAYLTWLSEGLPMKMNPVKPMTPYFSDKWPDKAIRPLLASATHANYIHGQQLYAARCASCHGADGQGNAGFPPLWGQDSYNAGAGLAGPVGLATWMERNMPLGNADLKPQEAADIALFVDAHPRPDFDLQQHLLPTAQRGVYNASVIHERDTVDGNLKKLGLEVQSIVGKTTSP